MSVIVVWRPVLFLLHGDRHAHAVALHITVPAACHLSFVACCFVPLDPQHYVLCAKKVMRDSTPFHRAQMACSWDGTVSSCHGQVIHCATLLEALGPMSYYCLCTLQIHFDPDQTGPRLLIEAVDDAGFDAEVVETDRWVQAE